MPLYPDMADYAVVKKQIILLKYAWKGKQENSGYFGIYYLRWKFGYIFYNYEQKKMQRTQIF